MTPTASKAVTPSGSKVVKKRRSNRALVNGVISSLRAATALLEVLKGELEEEEDENDEDEE